MKGRRSAYANTGAGNAGGNALVRRASDCRFRSARQSDIFIASPDTVGWRCCQQIVKQFPQL
jgi:hypothetical protein